MGVAQPMKKVQPNFGKAVFINSKKGPRGDQRHLERTSAACEGDPLAR